MHLHRGLMQIQSFYSRDFVSQFDDFLDKAFCHFAFAFLQVEFLELDLAVQLSQISVWEIH